MSVPDNRRNLLLVDNTVSNYTQIVDSVNTTISDVLVFNPSEHTYNDIVTMIRGQSIIGNGGYKSIGILQHNMRLPYYQCLKTGNKCTLISVAAIDSTLSSWSDYIDFITALKTEFSISFLDLLACALYSDPNWKYVIDQIADRLQIVIRASTDDTGAAELGGDWYLESHTGVNLKDVYFTDAIDSYAGLLDMMFMIAPSGQSAFNNVTVAPSTLAVWGDSLTSTILSTSLSANLSNITRIFSHVNGTHYTIFALSTSGVLYGFSTKTFGTYSTTNIINVQSNSGWIDFFSFGGLIGLLKSDGTVGFLTDAADSNAFIYNTTFSVSNTMQLTILLYTIMIQIVC